MNNMGSTTLLHPVFNNLEQVMFSTVSCKNAQKAIKLRISKNTELTHRLIPVNEQF